MSCPKNFGEELKLSVSDTDSSEEKNNPSTPLRHSGYLFRYSILLSRTLVGTKRPLSKAHVPDILDTANSRMSICLSVYMSICLYVYMCEFQAW